MSNFCKVEWILLQSIQQNQLPFGNSCQISSIKIFIHKFSTLFSACDNDLMEMKSILKGK
jgi:hypothetical protein